MSPPLTKESGAIYPRFFATREDLRDWFTQNHSTRRELWIAYPKKDSRRKGISYEQVVEEALCFGWVDGQVRSLGAEATANRYTPRRPGSRWSRVNVDRARRLIREGRMTAAGRAAFDRRTGDAAGYSYETRPTELSASFLERLGHDSAARSFFESQAPYYRRTAAFWVMSAKRAETQLRRFEHLLDASRRGRRIDLLSPGGK